MSKQPMERVVVVSGRVMPHAKVQLGPIVGGRVLRVGAEAGDLVQAGAELIALEASEAEAAVRQGEARVARARARLAELSSHDIRLAERHLERAEAELAVAQVEHDRLASLVGSGAVSKSQTESAALQLARAEEQREVARLQLGNARPVGGAGRTASAALHEADAELAAARARLAQMTIRAPAAGVLLSREVEPGDVVAASSRVMTIAVSGPTRLQVHPDERALGVVREGQSATASAEAFPQETFPAQVEWIAPSVDERRGTIEVRLVVAQPPSYLRPDMTVSVSIQAAKERHASVLPIETVHDRESAHPWVTVVRNGKRERREVRLGLVSATHVQILGGVTEDDEVLLPGAPVAARRKIHPWD
jgi:HlyD family secretion protein